MNPKIIQEKETPEAHDYPRWTPEMRRILIGIRKFREVIRAQMN